MAEANVPDTRASIDIPTPDEFSRLDQFHQREAYKRPNKEHNADTNCNHTEGLQPVRSQGQGDPDTSSAMDQTLVGRKSANGSETSLLLSLTAKEARNIELENMLNAASKGNENIAEELQNATITHKRQESMIKEIEEKLSASKADCGALTLQVNDLHVQLKDREDMIHTMTEFTRRDQEQIAELTAQLEVLRSGQERVEAEREQVADVFQENAALRQQTRRDQEQNAELSAQLEVLRSGQERVEAEREQMADVFQENAALRQQARRDQEQNAELSAQLEVLRSGQERVEAEREQVADVFQENASLRQQLQVEMWRNQILRNLLEMIARRSLERRLPNTEVIPEEI